MQQFFHNLKQKILRWKSMRTVQEPKMIQILHQQLFARLHRLDYLQWMQQNSGRYLVGMCLLVVLLSATVLWRQTPTEEFKNVAYSYSPTEKDASAIEVLDTKTVAQQEPNVEEVTNAMLPEKDVKEDTVDEIEPTSAEKEPKYLNPLHLSGYQAPTSGLLQYNYGLGYDPVYEDYRVHNDICYAAGDGKVFACVSGKVVDVHMNQHWQLAIQTQKGTICYKGLQTCSVAVNEDIVPGQMIGTTEDLLYIQVVEDD